MYMYIHVCTALLYYLVEYVWVLFPALWFWIGISHQLIGIAHSTHTACPASSMEAHDTHRLGGVMGDGVRGEEVRVGRRV